MTTINTGKIKTNGYKCPECNSNLTPYRYGRLFCAKCSRAYTKQRFITPDNSPKTIKWSEFSDKLRQRFFTHKIKLFCFVDGKPIEVIRLTNKRDHVEATLVNGFSVELRGEYLVSIQTCP